LQGLFLAEAFLEEAFLEEAFLAEAFLAEASYLGASVGQAHPSAETKVCSLHLAFKITPQFVHPTPRLNQLFPNPQRFEKETLEA
tara:strand:- start:242 stop:496 length:255 start_codon:yes stop_codon:yes gene_type:complete